MTDHQETAASPPPVLAVKFNAARVAASCGVCGRNLEADIGARIYVDGTDNLVCRTCSLQYAHGLVGVVDVLDEVEHCAVLDHFRIDYAEVQKLLRAMENYTHYLQQVYDQEHP